MSVSLPNFDLKFQLPLPNLTFVSFEIIATKINKNVEISVVFRNSGNARITDSVPVALGVTFWNADAKQYWSTQSNLVVEGPITPGEIVQTEKSNFPLFYVNEHGTVYDIECIVNSDFSVVETNYGDNRSFVKIRFHNFETQQKKQSFSLQTKTNPHIFSPDSWDVSVKDNSQKTYC